MEEHFPDNEHDADNIEIVIENAVSLSNLGTGISLPDYKLLGTTMASLQANIASVMQNAKVAQLFPDIAILANADVFTKISDEIAPRLGTALAPTQVDLANAMQKLIASQVFPETATLAKLGVFTKISDGISLPSDHLLGTVPATLQAPVASTMQEIIASHVFPDTTTLANVGVFANISDELLGTAFAPLQATLASTMHGLIASVPFEHMFPDPNPIIASSLGESLTIIGAGVLDEISTGLLNGVDKMSVLPGSELDYLVIESSEVEGSMQNDDDSRRIVLLNSNLFGDLIKSIIAMFIYDKGDDVVKFILKHL